jgi:DnaK suppressor protein
VHKTTYLDRYKRSLLVKQQELLTANGGRLAVAPAGGRAGEDLMDLALAESEAMIEARLNQVRSRLRQAIEWALLRIKKGNYGFCDACGKTISRARLKAIPWAVLCRACSEQENAQF